MSDIPNVELTDSPVWGPAKSTVNGQSNDQTLDRECYQALANRTAWLKAKLAAGFGTTKDLFVAIGAEKIGWTGKWRFSGSEWKTDSVQGDWLESLGLYFPIDLPVGSIITGGEVTITPPVGHSALPAYQPKANLAGEYQYVSASTLADYHRGHRLVWSSMSYVVTGPVFLVVHSEVGANALAGSIVNNAKITYTTPFG